MVNNMNIYIGADHNGFHLKQKLSDYLKSRGYALVDESNTTLDPADDFPVFAVETVKAMLASNEDDPKGILICGSGQGMVMAANRFKGIRASLVWNQSEARASRNDDDSNVLCLPARELVDFDEVTRIVDIWLNTPFLGAERFLRRIKQMDELI